MFCDVCGTKYTDGDLRATSKYCMQCGETLPKLIVDTLRHEQRREPDRLHVQPRSPSTPLTQTYGGAIAPSGGDEEDLYGSPESLRNETPAAQNSLRSPGDIHSPSPSVESMMDSDYEEPNIQSVDNESEAEASISIDPSPSTLSLNIADYDLPPPFPVPERCNLAFPRHIVGKILGGGHQITWPRARDRRHPMYACVRSNLNPTLPTQSGAHGIMITGPVHKDLVQSCSSFTLIIAYRKLHVICETFD